MSETDTPAVDTDDLPNDPSNAGSQEGYDENPGSSPETQDENLADDMLSAVEGAFGPDNITEDEVDDQEDEPTGDTSAPGEASEAQDQKAEAKAEGEGDGAEDEDEEIGDLTEEEYNSYRPRTQKRIKQLLAERNEAREVAEKAAPIVDFMQQNDIPQQDADVILTMAAQLRHGDFNGFLQAVTPYVQLAQQYVGQALPQDLHDQVQQGYITRKAASELASARMQKAWSDGQRKELQQRQQQQEQQREAETRAGGIRDAVNSFEAQLRQQDPDYGRKADIVRRTAQALMQEHGAPKTPEQAVQYVQAAYQEANRVVKSFMPKPKATRPTPSGVHQATTQARPEPKSMLDAAYGALGE